MGEPRFSNWSGRRRWTQGWCFKPERQSVVSKRWLLVRCRKDEYDHDPVITQRCAGIDVGKRGLAVAVAVGPADKEAEIKTRWFGTTVRLCRSCIRGHGFQSRTFWSRTYTSRWCARANIDPRNGDKTDFREAVELTIHHRHRLLTGSYLPERGIVRTRQNPCTREHRSKSRR